MTDFKPGYKWRTELKCEDYKDRIQSDSYSIEQKNHKKYYFDELVIDHWFHLEMMNENSYWMRIGDYRVGVKFDKTEEPEVYIEKD